MRELIDHFRQLLGPEDRPRFVGIAVLTAVGSAAEVLGISLIFPYLELVASSEQSGTTRRVAEMLASVGLESRMELVVSASVAMVAAFGLKHALLAFQWRQLFDFLYDLYARTSRALLDGYLRQPFPFHLRRNSAELVRNVTEECRRAFGVAMKSTVEVLAEGLVVLGIVAVLTWVQPLLTVALLLVLGPVGWWLTKAWRRRLDTLGGTRAEHQARAIQAVNQSLGGIQEVRLLGRERYFADYFGESISALTGALRDASVIDKMPRLTLETVAVVFMVAMGVVVSVPGVTVMELVPLVGLFGVALVRLLPSLNRIVNGANQVRFEGPAVEIIAGELEAIRGGRVPSEDHRSAERAAGRAPRDADPLEFDRKLVLEGVTFRYPEADTPALRDVSLEMERGSFVGVVGPSGSGKSTLVYLVMALLEPDEGRITADGSDVHAHRQAWQANLGYIPQDVYLLDDTVARNVAFGIPDHEVDRDRIWEGLRAAQLEDFIAGLPDGLETRVGERGVRISGGQRQRVAIARALYRRPSVLVLDEATSSLDVQTERAVMEAVEALAGERTVLAITHRLASVQRCRKIWMLEEGRVAAQGTYDELLKQSERFQGLAIQG